MTQMPVDTRLKIEIAIEDEMIEQEFRPYLGMSSLANPCSRKLWYGFRLCAKILIDPRVNRLFGRGHNEEPIIQADLKKAGVICLVDPKNQPEFVHGNSHIKGHPDDRLRNLPDAPKTDHLGEYKTHNDKSFKDLKKKGMRLSKPVHAGQMDVYMHKWKLTRGLYVAVNKNDDARYYERVAINKDNAEMLLAKGIDIIGTEVPPPKIGKSTWYECKWCTYYDICHFGAQPLKNCRTCKFGDICDHGKWECSGHKIELAFEQQQLGCKRHSYMEGLKNG